MKNTKLPKTAERGRNNGKTALYSHHRRRAGVNEGQRAFIRKVIRTALAAEGVDFPCEVDVLLTNDEAIHQINLDMREVDRATDVLSFPEFDLQPGELPGGEDADPGTGLVPLGTW